MQAVEAAQIKIEQGKEDSSTRKKHEFLIGDKRESLRRKCSTCIERDIKS
jgi:hypothetical protein